MAKVHLDFGHGGKDPGAMGNGLKEKDITLAVGLKVGEILKRHNVEVVYSRTADTFVKLSDRAKMANNATADIFVSIHCNAAENVKAQGVETFSYPGSSKGTALAKCIQDSMIQSKVYTKNRGIKTANFAVLRETKMLSALTEMAFISNLEDSKILRNKQLELAESVAKGILNYFGIRYAENEPKNKPINSQISILGKPTVTIEQMKAWAKNKCANQKFIDLAPIYYEVSKKAGVNPGVTYTQSAKETGYFHFGGVLDITFKNPCGLKTTVGGRDRDKLAHKRFASWEEGIQAQVDHLALYAGAPRYPKLETSDPRHFPYLKGIATTVESLGGKWAPSKSYGTDIVKMIKELENTIVEKTTEDNKLNIINIKLHGKDLKVEGICQEDTNYIPVRFLEKLGYKIGWENGTVVVDYKEVK